MLKMCSGSSKPWSPAFKNVCNASVLASKSACHQKTMRGSKWEQYSI